MVSAPQALREYVFAGGESSIASGGLEPAGTFASALGRAPGWRRVAVMFALAVLFAFIPALVIFIAHHLR